MSEGLGSAGALAKRRPVTLRAVAIGLVSTAVLCGITPYNDFKLGATYIAGNLFPIGALAVMLLLVLGVNAAVLRSRPQAALSPGELLTVWGMIVVASGIPSSSLMRFLIPHVIGPTYYATPENRWGELFLSKAPQSLMVTDKDAARWFFEGLPSHLAIPWGAWLRPLAGWGVLVVLLFLAFFCLTAILRKQWVEHEKLGFPLIRLPVMVAQAPLPGRRLNETLRSPLLWLAVAGVTALHTLKGLHLLFPEVPEVATLINADPLLEGMPWQFVRPLHMRIYPLVVGFAYFLSSEVCLSLWAFYLFYKLQVLVGAALNLKMPGVPGGGGIHSFASFESLGGCIALFGWMMWVARPHLRQVWAIAWRGNAAETRGPGGAETRRPDDLHGDSADGSHPVAVSPLSRVAASPSRRVSTSDRDEPLSYRTAVFGLMFAYAGMFAWQLWAGIGPLMGAAQLVIGTVFFVVLAWLVCQAGMLFVQATVTTGEAMVHALGSATFQPATHFMTSQVDNILMVDLREYMLPSLLNTQRAADEGRVRRRSLMGALAAAVVVSLVVSCAAAISLPYRSGGGLGLPNTWTYIHSPHRALNWAASMANAPLDPNETSLIHMLAGGVGVWLLMVLRVHYPTLGIHPAGFLIANGYPMYCFWFSFFLGWLFKAPVVRYGGLKGYVRLQPLFLGLVLGDCLNAAAWIAIGFTTGVGYSVMPG